MLNLIIGRAGTGKTALVQNEIKHRMDAGATELLLIVPEQYSHDAEKQLCDRCGDALSLHGEVLSFTRLSGRVFLELGHPSQFLDAGGQMLVMYRAIESVAQKLKVFGLKGIRMELLEGMLSAMRDFKGYRISAQTLEKLSSQASEPLSAKLHDLALILDAYGALLNIHGGDMPDMLTMLAEMIADSKIGDTGHIFFDGFNDFTAQELYVIEELMRKKADITVCLSYDLGDSSEAFELPRKTAGELRKIAQEHDIEVKITQGGGSSGHLGSEHWEVGSPGIDDAAGGNSGKSDELKFMERKLFHHEAARFPGECNAITIHCAQSKYAECEYAADKAWELIRKGYRWRDIGVMARDWEEYSSLCENVFEKYGIPYFTSGRADILNKPPVAHIDAALEISVSGWEYRQVFRYIKTGLCGISTEDCAELENYVLTWNIRGAMWLSEWTLPASGYGGECDMEALARLNNMRSQLTKPIMRLRDGIKGTSEASGKLKVLYTFLEEIKLPQRLAEKAGDIEARGQQRLANEYLQIWEIIIGAMEQMFIILGDSMLTAAELRKMFSLVLSRYDVGVIPVSLDRTALGSMAMSRRRDLKCLIILGATDENMPKLNKGGGALSDSEREELGRLTGIPAGLLENLGREMNMLYSTLTLPSRELILTYKNTGGDRPSFIIKRLKAMFGISEIGAENNVLPNLPPVGEAVFGCPADAQQIGGDTGLGIKAAELLYGGKLSLSPSRADKYYSCPFQHFLLSGLGLKPRIVAAFDAPMAGLFMHFVLEGVSKEIKETVGFKDADEALCRSLASKFIEEFVQKKLLNFEGKNARFIYLFRRIEQDVIRILSDMIEELNHSDFEPLNFELDFSDFASSQLMLGDSSPVALRGIIDRVDGWQSGGKLYLRVIDYKTGKKSFSLSDLMHGRDMQMLIYLFALEKLGEALYESEVTPAGVLYVPARDVILKASKNSSEDEIRKSRKKQLRRGGLVLSDPAVLNAMENDEEKQYLPVKLSKDGVFTGDSIVSPNQIALLSKHVDNMLQSAASEILSGEIKRNPFYKNENDNACLYCGYRSICTFDEENGDKRRFARKLKTSEIWEMLETSKD